MLSFLSEWWASLDGGALTTLVLLLLLTVALVRSSLHPTIFALVAWPGTVAHELAHALVGFILGAKPREFSLFPKSLGNGQWQLGAVGFVGLRWWNTPWTAMAPMLLAPLSVWAATAWAYPTWLAGDALGALWRLLICALVLQASWPSATDFKLAAPGIGILLVVAAILA